MTWADVQIGHSLREGYLPMPEVRWQHGDFALQIAAAADGPAGSPQALVRYALTNTGSAAREFTLLLAVRPWQVNPPQQFLSTPGGARRIERLQWRPPGLAVNSAAGPAFAEVPSRVTAVPGAAGIALNALREAPALHELSDEEGQASALLQWDLWLAPGETREVAWTAPLVPGSPRPAKRGWEGARPRTSAAPRSGAGRLGGGPGAPSAAAIDERLERVAAGWRARLNRVELEVPATSRQVSDTLRTALGADPDVARRSRAPARHPLLCAVVDPRRRDDGRRPCCAWARTTSRATSSTGSPARVPVPSGKVPCCVDRPRRRPGARERQRRRVRSTPRPRSGATPRDAAFVARRTGRTCAARRRAHRGLRQSERSRASSTAARRAYFGLMPPSISHEGYSDKPAYSYWDDFWALRGYKDAVDLARAMGQPDARDGVVAAQRDEFERRPARARVDATAARFGIDMLAGRRRPRRLRSDLDDDRADPAQARWYSPRAHAAHLRALLAASSASAARARARGRTTRPTSCATVGALVRLGQPERAHELLELFLRDRRPDGWNQWAEVVMARRAGAAASSATCRTRWVASDYIRSVLDMFAYEREADDALVLGAGLSRGVDGCRGRGEEPVHAPRAAELPALAGPRGPRPGACRRRRAARGRGAPRLAIAGAAAACDRRQAASSAGLAASSSCRPGPRRSVWTIGGARP